MMNAHKHSHQGIGLGLPTNGAAGRHLPSSPLSSGAESGTGKGAEKEMGLVPKLPD